MNWKAYPLVIFWLNFLLTFYFQMSAVGEGYISTVADVGAEFHPLYREDPFSAKTHSVKAKNTGLSKTGKRSFKRAFRRSIRDGFTMYHGRIFTPNDFNLPIPPTQPQVPSKCKHQPQKPSGDTNRLSIFCWNMGGMSSERYQCLLEWLNINHFDIVCIQESHWKFTNTWQTSQYHAVHSGDTTNHAGLLTLISKKLIKEESLTWTERVPGRLVQLKLRGHFQDLDLLHCYQHVHKPSKMTDRSIFWTALHDTVAGLPTRNRCCILGDFNTTLPVANAKVGLKDFLYQGVRHVGPIHRDWKSLHTVLDQFDFNALNSWTDLGPTYMHEGGASRIDHILYRNVHADLKSKQVKYLHQHPMHQTTGCRHVPIVTTIASRWVPKQTRSAFHWDRHMKQRAYLHYHQNTPLWNQQETIREEVTQLSMQKCSEDFDILHNCVNDCITFPKDPVPVSQIQMPRTGLSTVFASFETAP